jgi:hypothetical protein
MPLQERFRHAPGGARVERRFASEITSFVTDGGQSPQIRFWLESDFHSCVFGTERLKHNQQYAASVSRAPTTTRAGEENGKAKTAFRDFRCRARRGQEPGTRQGKSEALMSLKAK